MHRTLSEALAMVDVAALRRVKMREGRLPRMLDVACGTGIFLSQVLGLLPELEAYGIDASADMLAQAQVRLLRFPQVRLEQVEVDVSRRAQLPYAQGTFDLISCTNALHGLPNPVGTFVEVRQLLAPGGQLVLEDIARPSPFFLGRTFEGVARLVIGRPVRIYTLAETQSLCRHARLDLESSKVFSIDWRMRGWALRARVATS